MIYTIGLIDDNEEQLSDIRAAIKTNKTRDIEINFKSYLIPQDSENAINVLLNEIIEDVKEGKVHSLIIDYKIVVLEKIIKGSELLNLVKKHLSNFPVIILTEIPEESKKPNFIDSDKVYIKRDFLKVKEDYSKEKVNNIIDSIEKYVSQKDSLLVKLIENQNSINSSSDKISKIQEIIEIENQLSSFIPMNITQADKSIDKMKIANLIELII
ncbi:MAG: hypothetical protein J5527_05640 [Treponema sp.]|nr:hypothetical protein [Treponema sp.]